MVALPVAEEVAGSYTVNLTNSTNACGVDNWTEGNTLSNVTLSLMQDPNDDTKATATVTGSLSGAWLDYWIGSNEFAGTVVDNHVVLSDYGTRALHKDKCTYTVKVTIDARVDDDVIKGTVSYAPQTNGSPDCATLNGCVNVQSLDGTIPPKP
jgi:hypothetical protein